MAIVDAFDRASLGANWTTPGVPGNPASWDGTVEIIGAQGAVQPSAAAVTAGDTCIALYTGAGELSDNQYAEVELVGDFDFNPGYTSVPYDDYGEIGVLLNAPDPAGVLSTTNIMALRMRAVDYAYYSAYYVDRHLYIDLVSYAGGVSGANRTFINSQSYFNYLDFFTDTRIPAGTKIALQRREKTYTALLYSPDTGEWYKLFEHYSTLGASGGYPGIYLYTFQSQAEAQLTNFRAGGDGDIFPDGSPGVKSGLNRTLQRDPGDI